MIRPLSGWPRSLALGSLIALASASPPARAQDNAAAAAEALFRKGREAMSAKRYGAACQSFRESNRLDPAVGTLFNLALCERRRGRLASSWSLYRKVLQKLSPGDRRIPVAKQAAQELEPQLPQLTVEVRGKLPPGASLRRNALALSPSLVGTPLPVDPGTYTIVYAVPGHEPSEQTVRIAAGERRTIELSPGAAQAAGQDAAGEAAPPRMQAAAAEGAAPLAPGAVAALGEGSVEPGAAGAPLLGEPAAPEAAAGDRGAASDPRPFETTGFTLIAPPAGSSERRVHYEFGLGYSRLAEIDGFGLNVGWLSVDRARYALLSVGGTHVRHKTTGFVLAGGVNIAEAPIEGTRIAGVINWEMASPTGETQRFAGTQVAVVGNAALNAFRGVQLAGAFNLTGPSALGAQVAGGVNIAQGESYGAHLAGGANLAGGDAGGMQLAGLANVTARSSTGVNIAGGANVAASDSTGANFAGVANVTGGELIGAGVAGVVNFAQTVAGAQFAPINVSGGDVQGAQVGVINVGGHVTGLQLGVINLAQKVDGASIGLLPVSFEGGVLPSVWLSNEYDLNVGARFPSGFLITTISLGVREEGEETILAPGISLGGEVSIAPGLVQLGLDFGYRSEVTGPDSATQRHRLPTRLYASVDVLEHLQLFGGGGTIVSLSEESPDVRGLVFGGATLVY